MKKVFTLATWLLATAAAQAQTGGTPAAQAGSQPTRKNPDTRPSQSRASAGSGKDTLSTPTSDNIKTNHPPVQPGRAASFRPLPPAAPGHAH